MKKEQVIGILGLGELSNRHFFCDNELAIDYDENDSAEFIEFLGGIEGTLHPVIYGKPVFESNADELFEILRQHNNGEIDDSENGYSYGFIEISVGIYRTATPDWATIGIGKDKYYKN